MKRPINEEANIQLYSIFQIGCKRTKSHVGEGGHMHAQRVPRTYTEKSRRPGSCRYDIFKFKNTLFLSGSEERPGERVLQQGRELHRSRQDLRRGDHLHRVPQQVCAGSYCSFLLLFSPGLRIRIRVKSWIRIFVKSPNSYRGSWTLTIRGSLRDVVYLG
jgi:hypothetical protein